MELKDRLSSNQNQNGICMETGSILENRNNFSCYCKYEGFHDFRAEALHLRYDISKPTYIT